MRKPSDFIALVVVTLLFSYAVTVGATFNGLIDPALHPTGLGLLGLTLVGWLIVRWQGQWIWHRTPLDGVLLLWAVAFGLSLLTNLEASRRITIGLWYMGLYIGIGYVLHDAIANRVLRRERVVDALLIAGVVILYFAFLQLRVWLGQIQISGFTLPPRPVSTFGNPNFLGGFLVVLIPFILSRLFATRNSIPRIGLALYLLLAVFMLALTYSRGAWLGMVAGLIAWGGLYLAHQGLLSRAGFTALWSQQRSAIRGLVITSSLVAAAAVVAILIVVVASLNDAGRQAGLRTELWRGALALFQEQPLTGQGLFTFGREIVRVEGVQPDRPHSHAHSVPFPIAADLGLIGLVTLLITVIVIVRSLRQNWQRTPPRDRLLLMGAVAAVTAFGVHQLTDLPTMMPAVALTGLVALVLALAPAEPQPMTVRWRRLGHPLGLVGLWLVLLATGWWSSRIYAQYADILNAVAFDQNYRQGAERLQPVLDADPDLSLYRLQQAFLWGMAAQAGDADALERAIAGYEQFTRLEPGYALGWANLAGLFWQAGKPEAAVTAMERAATLDPEVWQFRLNLSLYASAPGDSSARLGQLAEVLSLNPDALLYPEVKRILPPDFSLPDESAGYAVTPIVTALDAGEGQAALSAWEQTLLSNATRHWTLRAMIALTLNDRAGAVGYLQQAESFVTGRVDEAWVHLGRAWLARSAGDDGLMTIKRQQAFALIEREPFAADDDLLMNIAYAQFIRTAIARWYLPQVIYPVGDPALLHFLDELS